MRLASQRWRPSRGRQDLTLPSRETLPAGQPKMRHTVLVSLVVVVLMVAPYAPQCEAQGWEALVGAVAQKLIELWHHGEVELLGHYCSYSVQPKFRKWQLYYKGRMWCPGWTQIRGEALTRSRSGVAGKTARDFVEKAFRAGLITEEETRAWLNN
ncbi:anti-lipopolysaccharide factor-like [Panulirus ornatus]|uniref:anti-lipopolysaccharide factor-like n=1 Tax=Panulirus ornatus TaxID=150431 RepID=UPI003A849F2F